MRPTAARRSMRPFEFRELLGLNAVFIIRVERATPSEQGPERFFRLCSLANAS